MSNSLTLCSLCGSRVLIRSKDPVNRGSYRFRCTGCGLTVNKGYITREEAITAWEKLNAARTDQIIIDSYVVPQGYTLVPAGLFHEICEFIRNINSQLFDALNKYNIWQEQPIKLDSSSELPCHGN